ncbi:hypothetical protein OK348_04890 [Flavobacterium sp. MXW15]|uniref:EF-hand domain-containing protein n=1 Tax=Xanthomonas chitinilytica TaxID=2989819 RepID=A0ABT3JS81_9XANT|nr:EF-hand domain-containing protein [Xanthomonas sp. H13-6]MCW4454123.1 hypothetical protein [Flavobacterium sp. MXW15]MCW4471357.1 EF-hand domain-containing protein [Xanthomonas sp. H13-6]
MTRCLAFRSTPLALALLAGLSATASAQTAQRPPAATSEPLREVPVQVRSQPLATGAVTHQAQVRVPAGEAPVTVRSIQPDNVIGNYRIDFAALDVDGDGFISREEAQANPALADEFNSLDTARRGKLAREQLAGWLLP